MLGKLEKQINSREEREKELKEELEELSRQLIGLKDANDDIIKFLKIIEADLKGKALYDFSWLGLNWVTLALPPGSTISSIALNAIKRNAIYSWYISMGTNLVTWVINDVFNRLVNKLNKYQIDDLKTLKDDVFPKILLFIVGQRIRVFEQEVKEFEQRIEKMNTESIVKTQHTLIQTIRDLAKHQQDISDLEKDHEKEIHDLNVKIDNVGIDLKKAHTKDMEDLKKAHKEDMEDLKKSHAEGIKTIMAAIEKRG